MSSPRGQQRTRKDAQRNRSRVLAAARKVFAARGVDASLEEIATEAGVGVGTVHRAFGSKDALIAALYSGIVDGVVDFIALSAAHSSGWEALRRIVWRLTELQTEDRALHSLLYDVAEPIAPQLRQRIEPVLTAVIERAKVEGAVRADLAATDIPVVTRAISSVAVGPSPEAGMLIARRHVEIFLKGIAATEDLKSIVPPLPDDDFASWLHALPRN